MKRRDFISLSAIAATTTVAAGISSCSTGKQKKKDHLAMNCNP